MIATHGSVPAYFISAGNAQSGEVKDQGAKRGWVTIPLDLPPHPHPSPLAGTQRRGGKTTESKHIQGPGLSMQKNLMAPQKGCSNSYSEGGVRSLA